MTSSTSPAPVTAPEGLAHRAGRAARWPLLSGVLQGGLQFAVGVALARLLAPDDFGIAALASVVVGLAALLLDLGIGSAVIQRRELSERHIRAAFTLGMALGTAVMALLWVLAPAIAA